MSQFKPCPFCGYDRPGMRNDDGDERSGYEIRYQVTCIGCGASAAPSKYQPFGRIEGDTMEAAYKRALENWNRRT